MGGDNGPEVIVQGALAAARELGIPSVLVGDEEKLSKILKASSPSSANSILQICHAPEVISMEDSPSSAIRRKPLSSIRVAFELVRNGEASGVVSPGNTGAVVAAGIFIAGTIRRIARPAIASLIPNAGDAKPTVLLDSGANVDCHAYQLVQFALMGSFYARSVLSVERPRVALLSNGSELSKGTDILRSAAFTLSEMKNINFIGYIEGRDIPRDVADVVVCDGFLGNVVLKTMEGVAELVLDSIKHHVEKSRRGKLGLWLAKPMFKSLFQQKLDPSAYGGAPLLGLNEMAIVCHGASNSRAIMNGIRVAQKFSDDKLVDRIRTALEAFDSPIEGGDFDDGIWNRMSQRFEKKKGKQKKIGANGDALVADDVELDQSLEENDEQKA